MSKSLEFGDKGRKKLLSGVEKLAMAVQATLGPSGRTVVLERPKPHPPIITKDGVSVAKEIELDDPIENSAVQMLKQAAAKTNDHAGDGTTTATVLAYNILKEAYRRIDSGANPIELKRGIDITVDKIVRYIADISKEIEDNDEIKHIATISANNDPAIGALICTAMDAVGKDGVITVEEGKSYDTELDIVEGLEFNNGYLSPYFVTNEKGQAELEKPLILLCNKRISATKDILEILEQAMQSSRSILLVAENVDGEALSTIIVNKVRGNLKIAACKAPGFGDKRLAMLEDIAALTGATVIDDTSGVSFEDLRIEHLGECERVVISKDSTTIVNGYGDSIALENRVESIRTQIESTTSDYEKEKLHERLAKLTGGVAVIKIGAGSEIEMKEKRDRLDDALNATKAAVQEGIIPGGGMALIKFAFEDNDELENNDQYEGMEIVMKAIQTPFQTILSNAGLNHEVIWNNIKMSDVPNAGYDARMNKVVDMLENGIVDPSKVTRTALQAAASVAGTMLTTECIVSIIPKETNEETGYNI